MIDLLKPLEQERKQLVDEQPVLDELDAAIKTQAHNIGDIEKAAADILSDLKRLGA